jgi:outer membrane protein insertion porin family
LFNEVNTAVQNPAGDELRKNVLVQLTEAKRWDFNYGFGFEAQTGNPVNSCLSEETLISLGIDPSTYKCSPNGKTGVSPAVLFDVTRTNVRGTNQSATLRTAYGTLEQRATLLYQFPHLFGLQKFDGSLSGGYVNSQDVTTYSSSQLWGSVRVTQRPDRRNTFIYEFSYRRVKVADVQVAPNLVPLYSQPVRVGGPGVTWVRDTRDSPLDAHRGTYNTIQEFIADAAFGSQANFNRIDMTNSSYYSVGKRKWVIARSTRFGMAQGFGSTSLQDIPLPERLYGGGAQSHRGFAINQAGPRDDQTGYPIGGAGVFINSLELRLPNPTLPYVGNNLGFVLFHDMGNVFNSVSDIGPSFLRFHQPDVAACKDTSTPPPPSETLTSGKCSFNYFSHAVGLGFRYHTPIGPIRVDFSVNLDPSYYPVFITYYSSSSVPVSSPPYHTNSGYFNFFFSIGQSF